MGAPLRVGVTGHRDLARPHAVAAEVDLVLDRLLAGGHPDEPRVPVCVSSLAEGADRVVARCVLDRQDGRLEVWLPLAPDDYRADFADASSTQEFNDLLAAADLYVVVPPDPNDASREAAYARAGTAVLRSADVLVALWDGEPARGRGGTAEVISEAELMGIPVEVIRVERAR